MDPLRSLAKQEPEFGCFRCYPVNYEPPKNECPDGSVMSDDKARQQLWGTTHQRYYSLDISYFNSSLGNHVLDVISRNNLWIRVLGSSSIMELEVNYFFCSLALSFFHRWNEMFNDPSVRSCGTNATSTSENRVCLRCCGGHYLYQTLVALFT